MSESFYGGKAGTPFVIAKSYNSVNAMITDFAKGPALTAVQYGEHVIINAEDKNNSNNGALYRRGYDYNNNMGGAIYVGTIVGPSGKAPMFELTTIENIKEITFKDSDEVRQGEGTWNISNKSLIPGKTDSEFNDDIAWSYITIRDQHGIDTTAWVGVKIPYHVIEMDAQSASAYYNRDKETADFKNVNLVERDDDQAHPFYSHWSVRIPKGIKGDALKNFRVVEASDAIQDYEGKTDDINNHRKVLVYDYYCYDTKENGEPKTLYLGDFNMIDTIDLADDGTFTITYTHDNTVTYTKKIKWITSTTLNSTTGVFHIDYNDGSNYETTLKWINGISLADNGTITFTYTTGDSEALENKIKWITTTELETNGTLTINYNDGTKEVFDKKIQWITNITLTDEGILTINYNNDTPAFTKSLIWPVRIEFDSKDNEADPGTQVIKVTYNNGTIETIGQPLNSIMRMEVNPVNYHLLVLFTNPTKRGTVTYDSIAGWVDYGAIKNYDGVLIGPILDDTTITSLKNATVATCITYLNTAYPTGLTGNNQGKVLTISQDNDTMHTFYGFDYDANKWKYLGSFDKTTIYMCAARETDADYELKKERLTNGGICFIIED